MVYPPEALPPVRDVEEAIQNALLNPIDSEPLPELLGRDAADDRVRRHLAAAAADEEAGHPAAHHRGGADDGGRRRCRRRRTDLGERAAPPATPNELRDIVGERVFRSFFPDGKLYNFDAEDASLTHLGQTKHGEDVEISKRAAESDLLVYVNVNLVAMDGGHKSTSIGLASYKSLSTTTTATR